MKQLSSSSSRDVMYNMRNIINTQWCSVADLPDPGLKPTSLMSPALSGKFFTSSVTAVCYTGKFLRV